MELLESVESLWPVELLKVSFLVYPLVNAVHIAAIGALWTSVLVMDLRVVGALRHLPYEPLVRVFRMAALAGFAVALATGLPMFAIKAREYASMPVFLIKMALILAAGLNFLLFLRLAGSKMGRASAASLPIKAAALSSIVLWSGVLVCGRLIGFL